MALTPAQIKAMNTGGVARVLRIRHGEYQVPGSQNGRVYTVLGTDLRALSCDCPAGRRGLDCYHRAAVAVRCAIEHACSIQSATGATRSHAAVPRGSVAPQASRIPAIRRHV